MPKKVLRRKSSGRPGTRVAHVSLQEMPPNCPLTKCANVEPETNKLPVSSEFVE